MNVRTTKTSSGATAVQVVEYVNRKTVVLQHVGSGRSEDEIEDLKLIGLRWIDENDPQMYLFPRADTARDFGNDVSPVFSLNKCVSVGFRYNFYYKVIFKICYLFKFHLLGKEFKDMLIDLVIVRLIEPDSKVRSLKFLDDYFGVKYERTDLYRKLRAISEAKDDVESKVVNFARKKLKFDFSLVFYDLTTLYFESFKDDELRKNGFSKDNKINQPQIMLGLLVNSDGFPISYQIFPGNKFEGHTMIPVINDLLKKYKIKKQDVVFVADAAMISNENINYLLKHNLNFIVGARIANLNENLINDINNNLAGEDNKTYRINDQKQANCHLITHFSSNRYRRDKSDMLKQINKANHLLKTKDPSQINKRAKFLTKSNQSDTSNKEAPEYQLNKKLIQKSEKLLGVKGYYTNLCNSSSLNDLSDTNSNNVQKLTDLDIIAKYRNLWQVEKSFRISKSDLRMRPIYHYKDYTIKSHILICFAALAISKYIEIKTGKSIKHNIDLLKSVTDARVLNKSSGKEFLIEGMVTGEIKKHFEKLSY